MIYESSLVVPCNQLYEHCTNLLICGSHCYARIPFPCFFPNAIFGFSACYLFAMTIYRLFSPPPNPKLALVGMELEREREDGTLPLHREATATISPCVITDRFHTTRLQGGLVWPQSGQSALGIRPCDRAKFTPRE